MVSSCKFGKWFFISSEKYPGSDLSLEHRKTAARIAASERNWGDWRLLSSPTVETNMRFPYVIWESGCEDDDDEDDDDDVIDVDADEDDDVDDDEEGGEEKDSLQ